MTDEDARQLLELLRRYCDDYAGDVDPATQTIDETLLDLEATT